MGLFDFLSRRPRATAPGAEDRRPQAAALAAEELAAPPAALSADEVRTQLFDAAAAKDETALATLCAQHEGVVLASFDAWRWVPPELNDDKLSWYGSGLVAVARHFAEKRGKPELLQRMAPAPDVEWEHKMAKVRELMDYDQYREAEAALRELMPLAEQLRGDDVKRCFPMTCTHLAECLFLQGDLERAAGFSERAAARCEADGDHEGVERCLSGLYEFQRYRADTDGAAATLERMAGALDRAQRTDEGAQWRRQAAIVRAGEPLCRVVAELDGKTMEVSDLPVPTSSVRFVFKRNRFTLPQSIRATDAGVRAAQKGDLDAALGHFERAAGADAFNPWPKYHAALALLELRRYYAAVGRYRATEALAPGWHHCRSDLWMAEQLAAGLVDHEVFVIVRQLDNPQLSADQIVGLAKAGIERCDLPILWLALGDGLKKLQQYGAAVAAFRRGLEDADEPDVRTRLLVAVAAMAAEPERTRRLHEAITLAGNLVATAVATVMLASNPTKD